MTGLRWDLSLDNMVKSFLLSFQQLLTIICFQELSTLSKYLIALCPNILTRCPGLNIVKGLTSHLNHMAWVTADGESFKKSWTDQKLTRCSDCEEFQLLEEKSMFKILYDQPTSWGSVCPTIYCSYSQCIWTFWTHWKIINTKIMTSYFPASIKSLLDKTMYRDDHGYFVSLFAHEYCTQSFLSGSESHGSYQHH